MNSSYTINTVEKKITIIWKKELTGRRIKTVSKFHILQGKECLYIQTLDTQEKPENVTTEYLPDVRTILS